MEIDVLDLARAFRDAARKVGVGYIQAPEDYDYKSNGNQWIGWPMDEKKAIQFRTQESVLNSIAEVLENINHQFPSRDSVG